MEYFKPSPHCAEGCIVQCEKASDISRRLQQPGVDLIDLHMMALRGCMHEEVYRIIDKIISKTAPDGVDVRTRNN